MARQHTVGIRGLMEPEVDKRAARAARKDIEDELEEVEVIQPEVDTGGAGGRHRGSGAAARGGMVGRAAGGGAGAGGLLGGLMSGGGLLKVALGGVIGVGILAGVQKLASASPALGQVANMFSTAMDLFFRPFGNIIADALRPFAQDALQAMVQFNRIVKEDGLAVGLAFIGKSVLKAFGNAIADVLTGKGSLGDFALLGGGALTARMLLGAGGRIGLGSLLSGISGGALARLLPSVGIGTILGKLSGGGAALASLLGSVSLGSVLVGVGSIAALIGGMASLGDLIDGDISAWNLPAKFGFALGEGFAQAWPGWADKMHTFFTNNIFHDMGVAVREAWEGRNSAPTDENSGMDHVPRYARENLSEDQGTTTKSAGRAGTITSRDAREAARTAALARGIGGGGGGRAGSISSVDAQLAVSGVSREDIERLVDEVAAIQEAIISASGQTVLEVDGRRLAEINNLLNDKFNAGTDIVK